jgi:hypothetical protein
MISALEKAAASHMGPKNLGDDAQWGRQQAALCGSDPVWVYSLDLEEG